MTDDDQYRTFSCPIIFFSGIPDYSDLDFGLMTLEKLLFVNRCIEDKACMEIYKNCCWHVQNSFDGLISHPAMVILTIFVNIGSWPFEKQRKLEESRRIKHMHNLFLSVLAKNWENCDAEKAKKYIDEMANRFALMNEIFPCPKLAMRLELTKSVYFDCKNMFESWIRNQYDYIENIRHQVCPSDIDQFIQGCKICLTTGDLTILSSVGKICGERSKLILKHQIGLNTNMKCDEIEGILTLSSTLNILKNLTMSSMEDQIKQFCGMMTVNIT